MEETRGLTSISLIPEPEPLLWTPHHHWTPHSTLLLIQQRVQNIAHYIQYQEGWAKSVSGACVIYEYIPRRYSPENIVTRGMNLMKTSCSRSSALSILNHTADTQPPSLHCKHKHSPPSHDENGSIKDLETMATPCMHKLANNQLDLGFGGWDHVLLALTSLPQGDCGGLAPRTLLPRPIIPNHCEWKLASSLWGEGNISTQPNYKNKVKFNRTRLVCGRFTSRSIYWSIIDLLARGDQCHELVHNVVMSQKKALLVS